MGAVSAKFISNLPEPLEVGHVIEIYGSLPHNANRFNLNLASGRTISENIPLHLSWRKHEDIIVRNTKTKYVWGSEERLHYRNLESNDLGCHCGHNFIFTFIVKHDWYEIAINGKPYCQYKHRLKISEVRTIIADGDIEFIRGINQRHDTLQSITVDHRFIYSQGFMNPPQCGTVVVITGTPIGSPTGYFDICLRQDNNIQIGLLISSRFQSCEVELNNFYPDNRWGRNKLYHPFPFKLHQKFRIAIGFGTSTFHIAIDGNYFGDFQFRTDDVYDTINALTIQGYNGLNVNIIGVDYVRDRSNMILFPELSSHDNPLLRNF